MGLYGPLANECKDTEGRVGPNVSHTDSSSNL